MLAEVLAPACGGLQWWLTAVCSQFQRRNWGYFKAVFWVLYICESCENYIFGNCMKYRSDRSKKFFCCYFLQLFFKFSTPILAKLRQCSASFWHFEASMHAFMIVCESAKISKKYENFQNLRNFDFFPNFFSRLICIKGLEYDWILLHARLFVWIWNQ